MTYTGNFENRAIAIPRTINFGCLSAVSPYGRPEAVTRRSVR